MAKRVRESQAVYLTASERRTLERFLERLEAKHADQIEVSWRVCSEQAYSCKEVWLGTTYS